jgi:hypothetical protein
MPKASTESIFLPDSRPYFEVNMVCNLERIKMPKRGVNWAFLKFIARIKSY